MFNLTDFAISKDDTRYVLNGVLLEVKGDELTLVATDGKRMAMMKKKLPKKTLLDKEVVVPVKTIQEVKRLLEDEGEVKIQFSDTQVMFSFPEFFIISRLIEGEFPNYKKVIPGKSAKIVQVSREDLLSRHTEEKNDDLKKHALSRRSEGANRNRLHGGRRA